MKKIKILYLVSSLKKCGPINILMGMINGLDRRKFDINVITLSKVKKGSTKVEFKDPGIKTYNLNNGRIEGIFKNLNKIQAFIDDQHIDICHSNDFRADHINSRLKRVITTNTIHNFPKEDYIYRYGKLIGQLMEFMHRKTLAKISYPIACSQTVSDKFLKSYHMTIQFIQNGVNIKEFCPKKDIKMQLREDLKLPLNKEIFIVSGALTTLKNPGIIIEAFSKLPATELLLIFIGDGHLLDTLHQENKNKNIIFLGRVEQVYKYLNACDYYISASLTEGLPNSVLEALSCELPSLLSNISPHVEIVGDSYPYLFDPEASDDLTEKIRLILKNNTNEISKSLKLKIDESFSVGNMSKKYQEVYLELIKKESKIK